MGEKQRIEEKERILSYLIRKGSTCNTYKVARELEMERFEVLDILNELEKENKVKLMHGAVKAITKELSEEEKVKTKCEVEELKERVEKLENWVYFTFRHLKDSIQFDEKLSKQQSKEDEEDEK